MTRADMIARFPSSHRAILNTYSDAELREVTAELDQQLTAATGETNSETETHIGVTAFADVPTQRTCLASARPELGDDEERHYAVLCPPDIEEN